MENLTFDTKGDKQYGLVYTILSHDRDFAPTICFKQIARNKFRYFIDSLCGNRKDSKYILLGIWMWLPIDTGKRLFSNILIQRMNIDTA